MLELCPCFERADDAISLEPKDVDPSYRDRGSQLHLLFAQQLRGGIVVGSAIVKDLKPYEEEGIKWAVDYVKAHLTSEYPMEVEQRLVLMDDKFSIVTFGTGDVVNGKTLFDLKTGDYHNYWLQMACYALMQMDREGLDDLEVRLLFSRYRKIIELTVTRDEASRRIFATVAAVLNPDKKPRANPYCKWCRKLMTCEAIIHLVSGTEHERYEIEDPVALSAALKVARILKEWVGRIEYFAKTTAIAGTEIPGFELKSRQGAREIMDVKRAYELAGLPPDDFIVLCSLPIGALEDAIAARESIPKTRAKKLVNDRLGDIIQRRPPSIRLALTQQQEEPTEK